MKKSAVNRKIRFIAMALAVMLVISPVASAAMVNPVEPRASDYLDSYQTYIYPAGGGEIQVWFNVTADDYMDELGALYVYLYESTDNINWTRIKSFSHEYYSDMLLEDDIFHMDHVTYQGVAGRYYKAYVCIWAGRNGAGDTRYLWTSAKRAT